MKTWKRRTGSVRSEQALCIRLVMEKEKETEKNNENVLFNVDSLIVYINRVSLVNAQNFDFKEPSNFNS
jgi:uncharacterized membrane-anchored protein